VETNAEYRFVHRADREVSNGLLSDEKGMPPPMSGMATWV